MSSGSPVLGRPSPAAAELAALRDHGTATDASFRAEGGDSESFALRAASVAGIRHRLAGQSGEDSFAWAQVGDRLVVAVADGLGGVPGSAGAASRAAVAAVTAIAAALGRDAAAPATVANAPATVASAPDGPASPPAQVVAGFEAANTAAGGGGATTLVVALVDGTGQASLARVGDSTALVVADSVGSWRELFEGPDDDGIATATAALPAADPQLERAVATLGGGEVLVLLTDGVADPWRDGPTTVAPALANALAGRPDPLDLAQLLNFSRQGCHDDRTLVGVWLTGATACGPPVEGMAAAPGVGAAGDDPVSG